MLSESTSVELTRRGAAEAVLQELEREAERLRAEREAAVMAGAMALPLVEASYVIERRRVEYLRGGEVVQLDPDPRCINYDSYRLIAGRTLYVYREPGRGLVYRRYLDEQWVTVPRWATAMLTRGEALALIEAAL